MVRWFANLIVAALWTGVMFGSEAAVGSPPAAQQAAARYEEAHFTVPFALIDNRVFVNVRLNGKGPFHFILDTGASADMDEHVARQLGLKVEDAGEGQGVGQAKQRFGQTLVAKFQLGYLHLDDVPFIVTPFGDSSQVFGTEPVEGVIGREVFERMVVTFDYVRRTLAFTEPDKFVYSRSGNVAQFERPRQIPVIEGTLDGVPGKFGVDTGARSALLLYGPFCLNNRLREKYGATLEGVTGWGFGGPVRSLLARAHEFKFGGTNVRDIVIRLSTQNAGLTTSSAVAGLIGPDVLSQFDVTFDYARSRIIFEKNRDYGRHDSYDRADLWMGQSGKVFAAVDVIAGGPAYDAGVKIGDKILAIDSKSTELLVLPAVREKMRRLPAGDVVHLLLETAGKQRAAAIKLRDLV